METIVKLYTASQKPGIGEVIYFCTVEGEACLGTYMGAGDWADWSGQKTLKTSQVKFWHHIVSLDTVE